jgi:hypothetical protein
MWAKNIEYQLNLYIMSKTIHISTDFLGEEYTLKSALKSYKEKNELIVKELKAKYGKEFIPNIHLYNAAIKNCKALIRKLESTN